MYVFDMNGTTRTFSSLLPDRQICIANPIADNPCGEWNELDLICFEDKIIHAVNGTVVSVLYNSRYKNEKEELVPLTKGSIKIQSEGGEQFVEYIRIKEIDEIPAEFSEAIKGRHSENTEAYQAKVKWVNSELKDIPGLKHHVMKSNALGTDVGYTVYTPEGYSDKADKHYPVLYFLHGFTGTEISDAESFSGWLSKAITQGVIPPVICVFPNGGVSYYRGNIERMIIEELIPLIDSEYKTISKAESRALAGFSMGGTGAVYYSIMHPELFCAAGSMGGEICNDDTEQNNAIKKAISVWKKSGYGIFMVNGDKDYPEVFNEFAGTLAAEGINHRVVILPDTEHNLGHYYERSVIDLLTFLGNHLKM